ncbi:peptidyl-tRNA hydrolase domain protein [Ascosphaera apis ARSEF 7405]|uniref:Peptidyl-tRNA hydrolase domain protein n=1 Tax=Ascosphaera apis ARSEF 7405 TaxID=392613 RepID=A0A167VGQ5_9EURO|nr:peptidyl-tRNA hydrolase domain protein [Ascosphaera apis ARSEF 7405]
MPLFPPLPLSIFRPPLLALQLPLRLPIRSRSLSSTPCLLKKQMPPRPKLDPADIDGSYLKGTGPGVVKCQETRSRSQNQKIAMEILAGKVELLEKGDQSRAAIVRETMKRRKASKARKSRRKYRKLEEEKKVKEGGEEEEEEDMEEEVVIEEKEEVVEK